MTNRTAAPAIKDAVDFNLHLKPYEKFILDNGVEVYAIHAGAEEVLQIEWVFQAGNWNEKQNLIAATTNYLLKNGTSKKSAFELNEHFEYYGSALKRGCYNETAVISLHCLNKHSDHLLPVVQELITDAVFPESEIQLYQQNNKQRLQVNLKKCDFVANRLIDEYLFGLQHPYGKYSTASDFDALTRDGLQDFYRQYYQQGTCAIFIAGKLPADIVAQLNRNFGHLPLNRQPVILNEHPVDRAVEKKYRITNDTSGVQGAIRLARPFPSRHHPDFTKVLVLNNIFGGFFGSRLMANIREDKGYTYGIHSYLQNLTQESAWMISTEAGREVCEATIGEIYKEMAKLRKKHIGEEELLLVKNYMMGSILGELDGPFQIISRWKNTILNKLPETYFYDSIDTIKTVSAEELKVLAGKYLQPDAFYELVVV
jgi:zinc protease